MKISLLGYMGSGKTTIGKELSAQLNIKCVDLDQFIQIKHKKTIPEIFSQEGEIKFRKYEQEALIEILNSSEDLILSLGGGTPAYYDNMDFVNKNSNSFYLRLTPSDLVKRLMEEKSSRPLIAHLSEEELPEFVAKHLFERRNFYEKAMKTIDVKEKTIEEIVQEIIQHLPLRPK